MTGSSIGLDTNQAIHVLNDVAPVIAWLRTFAELHPVVGELRFGALKSGRPHENVTKVNALVSRCKVLETRATTAELYAQVRVDLLAKGRPVPENDIWIAAACLEHGVPLATADKHFDYISGLHVLHGP